MMLLLNKLGLVACGRLDLGVAWLTWHAAPSWSVAIASVRQQAATVRRFKHVVARLTRLVDSTRLTRLAQRACAKGTQKKQAKRQKAEQKSNEFSQELACGPNDELSFGVRRHEDSYCAHNQTQ
jgi:hypothetical protein